MEIIEAYKALGLKRGADFTTVRSVWKQKVKELHPDQNMDKTPEERQEDAVKLRNIIEAYAAIKSQDFSTRRDKGFSFSASFDPRNAARDFERYRAYCIFLALQTKQGQKIQDSIDDLTEKFQWVARNANRSKKLIIPSSVFAVASIISLGFTRGTEFVNYSMYSSIAGVILTHGNWGFMTYLESKLDSLSFKNADFYRQLFKIGQNIYHNKQSGKETPGILFIDDGLDP